MISKTRRNIKKNYQLTHTSTTLCSVPPYVDSIRKGKKFKLIVQEIVLC